MEHHLASAGLGEIVHAIGHALQPLAPLAAQMLWFSQPGFALFGQSEAISSLAELLNEPQHFDCMAQPETDE